MLKPQDVVGASRLAMLEGEGLSYPALAAAVGISASEAHAAVQRGIASGLIEKTRRPRRGALLEFLVHGLKYAFPPEWKGVSRGVPTSAAAPPLQSQFASGELPPVWPHPHGSVRGEGLVPLYRSAPDAALRDPALYEWLALIDAVRAGRARERNLAVAELTRRLA
jgi:hypothetical protein